MKIHALLLCLILLLTVHHAFNPVSAGSSPISTHKQVDSNYPPEFLTYTFNYSFDYNTIILNPQMASYNHSSGSVIKTFPGNGSFQLRDVTTLSLFCFILTSQVDNATITASLNGVPALNTYFITDFTNYRQNLLFILDQSSSAYLLPTNSLNITAYANFPPHPNLALSQVFTMDIWSITIHTAYRQNFGDLSQLNQSNSHVTALLINPFYNLETTNIFFNGTFFSLSRYDYYLDFLLIMPYQIENYKKSCYFNITFSYNFQITIFQLSLEHFALLSSSIRDYSASYLFRYVPGPTDAVANGFFRFSPKVAGLYHFYLTGQLYISNEPVLIFPSSREMQIFLFLNVSIIIPVLTLSKLIYKRLRW